TKFDVAFRRNERHGGSRGCADRSTDGRAHSASGQSANQDASAGPAADPQQVVLQVATAKFTGRVAANGIVLPVHVHRLQREQQLWTTLESSRFKGRFKGRPQLLLALQSVDDP